MDWKDTSWNLRSQWVGQIVDGTLYVVSLRGGEALVCSVESGGKGFETYRLDTFKSKAEGEDFINQIATWEVKGLFDNANRGYGIGGKVT